MSLQKLELVGLRGFATQQELPFAIPNGNPGSGLTTLVGPNNGGKSTVIEALRALSASSPQDPSQPQSFTEGRRNKLAGDRIDIQATNTNGDVSGLRTVLSGGNETKWSSSPPDERIFVLPSRRYFDPLFHKSVVTRDSYILNFGSLPTRGAPLNQFGSRLFLVQQNRASFDAELGKVINPVPKWTIDQTDSGQYYLKIERSGQHHSSEGMGEGLVSLLIIIDALYDSNAGDVIVIDEPELSLHPSLQRRLFALLREYAADRQIVIATHSPYFADFEALLNGARIARLHLEDGSCVISALSESTVKSLARFLNNYNNPHILGLDARETFFLEDGVILVEGQEDVVFYQKIADQLEVEIEGNFFGWGVGGADNMRIIAALLSELGFKKVVGLLDGNRASLLPSLESEFPQYRFHSIPADDIRTKPESSPRAAVTGILDESHRIRSEHVEPMKELLMRLNQDPMTKVKVCGITNPEDAHAAAEAGADAIGLVFAESSRRVSVDQAREIANALPGGVLKVGVFVDSGADEILRIAREVGLDIAQLHGDETPETVTFLRGDGVKVMKALRVRDAASLEEMERYGADLYLLDAYSEKARGGTGERFDWELAKSIKGRANIVVSGGLSPENVRDAIRFFEPCGVDASSSLENAPGRKNGELVRRFVSAAKGR